MFMMFNINVQTGIVMRTLTRRSWIHYTDCWIVK